MNCAPLDAIQAASRAADRALASLPTGAMFDRSTHSIVHDAVVDAVHELARQGWLQPIPVKAGGYSPA